jgi:hypothetical protein
MDVATDQFRALVVRVARHFFKDFDKRFLKKY